MASTQRATIYFSTALCRAVVAADAWSIGSYVLGAIGIGPANSGQCFPGRVACTNSTQLSEKAETRGRAKIILRQESVIREMEAFGGKKNHMWHFRGTIVKHFGTFCRLEPPRIPGRTGRKGHTRRPVRHLNCVSD